MADFVALNAKGPFRFALRMHVPDLGKPNRTGVGTARACDEFELSAGNCRGTCGRPVLLRAKDRVGSTLLLLLEGDCAYKEMELVETNACIPHISFQLLSEKDVKGAETAKPWLKTVGRSCKGLLSAPKKTMAHAVVCLVLRHSVGTRTSKMR